MIVLLWTSRPAQVMFNVNLYYILQENLIELTISVYLQSVSYPTPPQE